MAGHAAENPGIFHTYHAIAVNVADTRSASSCFEENRLHTLSGIQINIRRGVVESYCHLLEQYQ
jgi:hypothetical protein